MKKGVLIIMLLIAAVLIAGCSVSDYLIGNVVKETKPSGSDVNEDDILKEIEELTKDIEGIEEETNISDEKKAEEEEIEEILDKIEEEGATDLISDKEKYIEEVDYSKDVIKLTVKENEEVRLKPKAEDADLDRLDFTFTEPFNKDGYWKTNYGDAGEYEITITVSDGVLKTSKKVLLTVQKVNVPPIIDIVAELEADEGDLIKLEPKISDPNKDEVSVKISDPVGDDGEWQLGYTDHGSYTVTITASDGELESKKDVKLKVKRKNMAPVIKGIPEKMTVNEGDVVELKPEVSDLNKDKVSVKISAPIGDDGIWETGYTDHGEYTITITASDEEATTTKVMKLIVNDINKAPVITDIKLG